ncbi:hypothetical protein [Streptomyces sp. 8N706]|uniref:hypothetical protein n=1 Tax=Streptomyces sp. 8N706 TaxID=3457416 RepID=UPI003FD50CED
MKLAQRITAATALALSTIGLCCTTASAAPWDDDPEIIYCGNPVNQSWVDTSGGTAAIRQLSLAIAGDAAGGNGGDGGDGGDGNAEGGEGGEGGEAEGGEASTEEQEANENDLTGGDGGNAEVGNYQDASGNRCGKVTDVDNSRTLDESVRVTNNDF